MARQVKGRTGAWKPEREDYFAALRRHRIDSLIHYTPAANLPSIFRSGGVFSRKELARRGIVPVAEHGWGEKWKPLADYVCLCFEPPLGLLRREKRPVAALVVRPEVIALRETLFCPMNSAKSWIEADEILCRWELESFENLFRDPRGPLLRNRESEVLVRRRVPLSAISRVVLSPDVRVDGLGRLKAAASFRRLILREPRPRWSTDRDGEFFP